GGGCAVAYRLDAELDRASARGAGGRHRNGRALGAEAIRQMLGHRAEQAALVDVMEAAGSAGAQEVVVADRVVGAGAGGERLAVRPLDLDRRDREEQRTREVAPAADTRPGQRF